MTLSKRLKSRKFWLGVVGAVVPYVVQGWTGALGWEMAAKLSTAALTVYILGEAGIDASSALTTPPPETTPRKKRTPPETPTHE